jgi:intracellular multiplication protein IcmJ
VLHREGGYQVELRPIIITAQKGSWRKFTARKRSQKFLQIQARVHTRDNHTCQYCGFYAKEFQEIVNADQDYDNNKYENMVTACCFCSQCFFLESLGLDEKSGGMIIHTPEISQSDLNNFCRVLFCSMDKESAYKGKLQAVYLSLKDRGKDVENCFGPNTSDPRIFGQSLIDAQLREEQLDHEVLQHLRLLPSRKEFREQIDYWKRTVFAKVPL